MKTLTYVGNFDVTLLRDELLAKFPTWREMLAPNYAVEYFGISYSGSNLSVFCPDDTVDTDVDDVIKLHDSTAAKPIDWEMIALAKNAFMNLPSYATWTPEEAEAWIENDIFGGQTEEQINTYIDTNVTTIATARTALKLVAKEVLDLKEIVKKEAYLLMLLRNIVVKRSLL